MQIHCTEELHRFGGPGRFLLARAENILPSLIKAYRGQVQLIYLDPPFGTGDTFRLKLPHGKKQLSLPAYADDLPEEAYLAWMRTILTGCKELLSPTGCLYLHIDHRMSAQLRLMLDEIFGKRNFMNEIIWSYKTGGRSTRYYPRKHDNILFYRKSGKVYFDITAVGKPRGAARRNHMKRFVDDQGRVCFSIRSGGKVYTYYEDTPIYPTDVWTDIEHLQQKDKERVGYGTQKPEALLRRILLASSKEGDLVMDLFSGSGTTAAVAGKLRRKFVAVDASPFALYALRSRLLKTRGKQTLLSEDTPADGTLYIDYNDEDLEACHIPPLPQTAPPLKYTMQRDARGLAVTVEQAEIEKGKSPICIALGTASGTQFLPVITDCLPNLPKTYRLPADAAPVLQIMDTLGRQAFYTLEETHPET